MEPEPLDPSILHGQHTHWSSLAWEGAAPRELHCRRREANLHQSSALNTHIIQLLQQEGFYGVARLGFMATRDSYILLSSGGVHDHTPRH